MSSHTKRRRANQRKSAAGRLGFEYKSAPRIKPGEHENFVGKEFSVEAKWFGKHYQNDDREFRCEVLEHDPNHSFERRATAHGFRFRFLEPENEEETEQTFWMNAEFLSYYFEKGRLAEDRDVPSVPPASSALVLVGGGTSGHQRSALEKDGAGPQTPTQETQGTPGKQRSVVYSCFAFVENYTTAGGKDGQKWSYTCDDKAPVSISKGCTGQLWSYLKMHHPDAHALAQHSGRPHGRRSKPTTRAWGRARSARQVKCNRSWELEAPASASTAAPQQDGHSNGSS